MPTGLVHDEDGMRVIGHMMGYFCQVQGDGMGIAPRHHESGSLAVLWTDGTEHVGRPGSLVIRG